MKSTLHWSIIASLSCLLIVLYLSQNRSKTAQPAHVNIICIGDSVTQGGRIDRDEYTYRLPLYRLLKNSGLNFNYIGVNRSGVDTDFKWPADFEPNHEGFYGQRPAIVRDKVIQDLAMLPPPDIAIIHMGTQHNPKSVESSVMQPMREIIAALRNRNPNVKVVIMQIPGIWRNKRLHVLTWVMAYTLSTPQSEITTVPLYWDWDIDQDTYDKVHPNTTGQHKIAQKVYSTLIRIVPINSHASTK